MCAHDTQTHTMKTEIIKRIRSSVVEMYLTNFIQEIWMDKKKNTDCDGKVN